MGGFSRTVVVLPWATPSRHHLVTATAEQLNPVPWVLPGALVRGAHQCALQVTVAALHCHRGAVAAVVMPSGGAGALQQQAVPVVSAVKGLAVACSEGGTVAVVVAGNSAAHELVARWARAVLVLATAAGSHRHLVSITLELGVPLSGGQPPARVPGNLDTRLHKQTEEGEEQPGRHRDGVARRILEARGDTLSPAGALFHPPYLLSTGAKAV